MSFAMFIGGSKSGKSRLAQEMAEVLSVKGEKVCVAVFGDPAIDEEFARRIELHKLTRPSAFQTIEAYSNPLKIFELAGDDVLLIDDLASALGAIADQVFVDYELESLDVLDEEIASKIKEKFLIFCDQILRRPSKTIVVSSELGMSLVSASPAGRMFVDLLGLVNQMLVQKAHQAYLVVASRAIDLKDKPLEVYWKD
ncbi:MAG: bifunctional adenosylcobinamide kinase/adenosylcobinamide-phosphate guanylyltransferase [Coriobacteriia bacterium]|nr:bifunctional adenosylcobinamide kinase/adenosylcobinamide-phosphate guanylyltransferase [Coriobacteriia bacterium]